MAAGLRATLLLVSAMQCCALIPTTTMTAETPDIRAFRARLIQQGLNNYGVVESPPETRWAHRLVNVEKGALLLAADVPEGEIFEKSVVFIMEHSDAIGSSGLILNRPTESTMGAMTQGNIIKLPGMENNRLYTGGVVGGRRPDGLDVMNFMHGRDDVPGEEVIKGVKLGGLAKALKLVADGTADPKSFKFFTRYTGWLPGQLQQEIRRGAWIVAACDVETILDNHDDEKQPYTLWDDIHARLVQSHYNPRY